MIDGLKVQMTSEELSRRLAQRIQSHRDLARECEEQLRRPPVKRDDRIVPDHMLEFEMREHIEEVEVLTMLRDHLLPDEVYCLSEQDLRFADLVPDAYVERSFPRRRPEEEPAVEVQG